MDIFSTLNLPILGGIVAVTELLKRLDKNNKLKGFWIGIQLIIAAIASLIITSPFSLKMFFSNLFIYGAISAYGYDLIKSRFVPITLPSSKPEEKK